MRILKLHPILFCLLLLGSNPLFSQTIRVKKPGKLSKQIKASSTMEKLQIEGILNSDDWAFLSTCSNLKELDLSNAQFEPDDRSAKKGKYIQRGILTIPAFEKLEKLLLPTNYDKNSFRGVHILKGTLANLTDLKMPARCTLTTTYPIGEYLIHKLEVTGETNTFKGDKQDGTFTMYVGTLIIPTAQDIACEATKQVFPIRIIHKKGEKEWKILNKWWDNLLDISILEQVDSLGLGCFGKSEMEKITIPSNIKTIPAYCFYECTNLKEIDLGKVTTIEKYAFAGTNIEKLNIPASVTEIEDYAFSGSKIKQLEFQGQYSPIIFHTNEYNTRKNAEVYNGKDDLAFWRECEFIIPEGSRSTFAIGTWEELALKEKGGKRSYNIVVKKPGTILSHLPLSNLSDIDSLTITGFLYDIDMNIIKKCKSLKYVDITHAFISESPETQRKKKEEIEIFSAYMQLMGAAAEMQYRDGNISSMEYLATQGITELGKAASEFHKADNNCFVPSNCFTDLQHLRIAKLPLRAVSIGYRAFAGCANLEIVELPPYLEALGKEAFVDCRKLMIESFPKSITRISFGAFKNCSSLAKVDLSACTVKGVFELAIFNGTGLEELHLPNGIESVECSTTIGGDYSANAHVNKDCKIYFPESLKRMDEPFINCELHFKTQTPPKINSGGRGNTIYIPKDCTTAYYSAFGDENSYQEE